MSERHDFTITFTLAALLAAATFVIGLLVCAVLLCAHAGELRREIKKQDRELEMMRDVFVKQQDYYDARLRKLEGDQ